MSNNSTNFDANLVSLFGINPEAKPVEKKKAEKIHLDTKLAEIVEPFVKAPTTENGSVMMEKLAEVVESIKSEMLKNESTRAKIMRNVNFLSFVMGGTDATEAVRALVADGVFSDAIDKAKEAAKSVTK